MNVAAFALEIEREQICDWRARCAAICRSPEAEGRWPLVDRLCLETDLTVNEAIAVLRGSPLVLPANGAAFR